MEFWNRHPFNILVFFFFITGDLPLLEILTVSNTSTLKKTSEKQKAFFEKTGILFFVGNTAIENGTFPYKTASSEAYVKTE